MRILVIGGTRFIGHAATLALCRRGHALLLVNRGITRAPGPLPDGTSVERLRAQHAELATLRDRIGAWAPDVALDMIASSAREADTLVAALSGVVARVVAISSVDVYGACERLYRLAADTPADTPLDPPLGDDTADAPLCEGAPLRTTRYPRRQWASGPQDFRHHYDKLHVEQALHAAPFAATILRLAFVYGPHDYRRRVASVLDALRAEPASVALEAGQAQWRCTRAFVSDVGEAIARALLDERSAHRTYNVGEPHALDYGAWVGSIARAAGLAAPQLVSSAPRCDWRYDLVVDSSRIRAELAFSEPVGAALGLERSVAAAMG